MSDQPIEQQRRDVMNVVASILTDAFRGYGFCLLVFDLNSHDGRMNYISNAQRKDMLTAMREFIAHCEGRVHATEVKQ